MGNTYKVNLASEKAFEIAIDGDTLKLNGAAADLDIASVGKDEWSVIQDNQSYSVKLVAFDAQKKTISLSVNEEIFEMEIKDRLDLLLDKMGMSQAGSAKLDKVVAPMPGLVLNIMVEVGQTIEKGDALLILEAMKMENVIKASGTGTVKAILVKNQDAVEKNQLLIEME